MELLTEFESESAQSASISHDVTPPVSPEAPTQIPARRRSLSNVSLRSTRSLSALSLNKVKVRLAASKGLGNIARKLLLFRALLLPPGENMRDERIRKSTSIGTI